MKKVYAVKRGIRTGIFTDWQSCKEAVDGFKGALYKGFANRTEAEAWLRDEFVPTFSPKPKKSSKQALPLAALPLKEETKEVDFLVYTDGSCLRNPAGPGGWAAVIIDLETGEEKEISGGSPSTTNNRMEMQAAIKALTNIPQGRSLTLCTDSQYLKNGITKWIYSWKKRNWQKADGTPVLNQDLWQALDRALKAHTVYFQWVKGHAGNHYNEICDTLARKEASRYLK